MNAVSCAERPSARHIVTAAKPVDVFLVAQVEHIEPQRHLVVDGVAGHQIQQRRAIDHQLTQRCATRADHVVDVLHAQADGETERQDIGRPRIGGDFRHQRQLLALLERVPRELVFAVEEAGAGEHRPRVGNHARGRELQAFDLLLAVEDERIGVEIARAQIRLLGAEHRAVQREPSIEQLPFSRPASRLELSSGGRFTLFAVVGELLSPEPVVPASTVGSKPVPYATYSVPSSRSA